MEIYKNIDSKASKEFEKLLNSQISKSKIVEGKIIDGKVTKITDKYVYLYIENLKSEPILDISEIKTLKLEGIKIGTKIPVLLEKIEDRNGDVIVSAIKAQRIKGWHELEKAYEKKEIIMGKITGKVKGGVIVEHVDTGSLMFCPGSQISDKPLKDISHLMNEPQKFALIKLDKLRGNACVSRRQIITSNKKEDKAKIVEKYKVGDVIKGAIVKGYSSFGCFFDVNSELDVLVHLHEISYSRVNHPEEVFNIGEKHNLLVISVDKEKLQVGCSIKQLTPDPFENIKNYKLNTPYKAKVVKIMEYGAFCELDGKAGLTTLLHSSELSWTKKNVSAKKMLKVDDEIECVITEIDKEKRRVSISHRLAKENPFSTMQKKYPEGSIVEGKISSINEYAIYLNINDLDIDAFLHCNDLTYKKDNEEELKKYKKNDSLKVKVLEIKPDQQKIRVGLKQLEPDPFDWFKNKKVNDQITVKVTSSDSKGLKVIPEGADLEFIIKKSQIAINTADARPNRFIKGDRIDAAISELEFSKRKVSLSIKLLEELQNQAALKMGSNPLSGRQLPFSSLSDKLENSDKKKKK